jgi:hypothetical protein
MSEVPTKTAACPAARAGAAALAHVTMSLSSWKSGSLAIASKTLAVLAVGVQDVRLCGNVLRQSEVQLAPRVTGNIASWRRKGASRGRRQRAGTEINRIRHMLLPRPCSHPVCFRSEVGVGLAHRLSRANSARFGRVCFGPLNTGRGSPCVHRTGGGRLPRTERCPAVRSLQSFVVPLGRCSAFVAVFHRMIVGCQVDRQCQGSGRPEANSCGSARRLARGDRQSVLLRGFDLKPVVDHGLPRWTVPLTRILLRGCFCHPCPESAGGGAKCAGTTIAVRASHSDHLHP